MVDVDGVLADFTGAALRGTSLKPENVKSWELFDQLNPEEVKYVKDKLSSPYFWAHEIKPREDARGFGDRLSALGFDHIIVVTSPWNQEVIAARAEWMYKHFKNQFDALAFEKHKQCVPGDLLIDDGVHNLSAWAKVHGYEGAVCMAQPYNVDKWSPRIANWYELEEVVRRKKAV